MHGFEDMDLLFVSLLGAGHLLNELLTMLCHN
jgi:hypothetical protein